jgi:hypothetical protein
MKNKKGSISIEALVTMIIFVMLAGFLVDLLMVSYKHYTVSRAGSYLARTVGIQSGILPNTPNQFPGGSENYTTSYEMYNKLNETFSSAGVKENQWRAFINGQRLTPSTQIQGDYLDTFTIEIQTDYTWIMTKNIVPPLDRVGTAKAVRSVVGEYKVRTEDWYLE